VTLDQGFDRPKVDAQPGDLHELAAPADDLVQPVRSPAGIVTGPELVDVATPGKVRRAVRVAEHDVRPAVHELAGTRWRAGVGLEPELAAGDRHADALRAARGQRGW
jgi:hypothetical protein